jgi:hypothetical protein
VLARDDDGVGLTRILRWDPGLDASPLGPAAHNYVEEVLILSGSMHDLSLDMTFTAGDHACRPPGGGARSLGQQSGLRDVRAPLRAATLSTEAPAATSNGSPTGRRERSRQGRSWSTTTISSALPLLGCRKLVQLSSDDAPRQ